MLTKPSNLIFYYLKFFIFIFVFVFVKALIQIALIVQQIQLILAQQVKIHPAISVITTTTAAATSMLTQTTQLLKRLYHARLPHILFILTIR